jgi:N-acetylglucosamine-6-phosphate deacetylase
VDNDHSGRSAATDIQNQSIKLSSRVGLISSSSSSSSFTTSSASSTFLRQDSSPPTTSCNTKSPPIQDGPATKRSSTSITDDSDAPIIHDDDFGGDGPTIVVTTTRLRNARILQRDGTLLPGSIDISNIGIITAVRVTQMGDLEEVEATYISDDKDIVCQVIDCQNHILSPGYIDIQLNGAFGIDFSEDGSSDNEDTNLTALASNTRRGLEVQDVRKVAQHLIPTGVTSFCPTMVSSSPQTYRRIIPLIRKARNEQQKELVLLHQQQQQRRRRNQRSTNNENYTRCSIGASILGMHLEGPFFAPAKHGAHDLHHVCAPIHGISTVKEVYGCNNNERAEEYDIGEDNMQSSLEDIDIITLAPELPGAYDAIQSLTRSDNPLTSTSSSSMTTTKTHSHPHPHQPHAVVVSCGHTNATYDEGMHAIMSGATLITHLFNAMNPFHHRNPGLVGLLSSSSLAKLDTSSGMIRPYYSVIVDGIHVHESAVSMAYQCHPHGCILVTDAMAAMGLDDGLHSLGNVKVCIKGDRATVAGSDTLAGSVVSMDKCVKRFRQFTSCSIGEALLCATLHPAMVLTRHTTTNSRGGEGVGGGIHNNEGGSSSAIINAPIGILEVGARADIILLNEELDVLASWVGGLLAFWKGNEKG